MTHIWRQEERDNMVFNQDPSLFDDDDDQAGFYQVEKVVTAIITTDKLNPRTREETRNELSFVTLTSPDQPTRAGVAEVLPLTTIWKPLDSAPCGQRGFVDNAADVVRSCLPPHAQNIWEFNGHYSPGICPESWTIACTGEPGSSINGKTIQREETVGFCVPATVSNIVCRNDRSKVRFFTTLNQYAYDVDLLPLEVRWQSSDLSVLETTPNVKDVPGPVTKLKFEYVRSADVPITPREVLKPRDDLTMSGSGSDQLDPATSWFLTSSSTNDNSIATAGSEPSPTPGISQGAKAGIGVGVGAVVVLLLAAGIFLFRWKRRQKRGGSKGVEDGGGGGGGGLAELHGNNKIIFEKDSGHEVVEKDATPISRPGDLDGTTKPGEQSVEEKKLPLFNSNDDSVIIAELPSTPRQATLPPLPTNPSDNLGSEIQQPRQFPYTYMGSAPQWQSYQEPEQPSSVYKPSLPTQGLQGQQPLPPQESGAPISTPPLHSSRVPPVAARGGPAAEQIQTTITPSNLAYQVEREQLARLQERRERLLELERIDREEEEILRRIQQQEQLQLQQNTNSEQESAP